VNRLAAGVSVLIVLLVALALPSVLSSAQEAEGPQTTQIVAAIDITPLRNDLAALKTEMATLRAAVADPDGLRGDVAKAAEAVKAMDQRLTQLAELVKKQGKLLEPVSVALDPKTAWEYRCLRTRSEAVANRLAREGWQLVTASGDWLYFKRLAPKAEKQPER